MIGAAALVRLQSDIKKAQRPSLSRKKKIAYAHYMHTEERKGKALTTTDGRKKGLIVHVQSKS